jgi:hypothetical protein
LPFETPPGFRVRNLLLLALPGLVVGINEAYAWVVLRSFDFLGGLESFLSYPIDDPFRLLSFISFDIGIPLMSLALFGGLYLVLQRSRSGLLFLLGAVVPVALLLVLSPLMFTKARYAFVTLPFWAVLAAVAVKELVGQTKSRGKLLGIGVLMLLLADAAGADLLYYQINHGNRRDWRRAFTLIRERRTEDDIVVATRSEVGTYYLGEEVRWMGDIPPGFIAESDRRFWFVTDSESVWVTGEIREWVEENAELIDVLALRVPEDISLRIYLYDPARYAPQSR